MTMKIAVIGPKGLPPQQGGIEHYCAELYPRIVAQGHSVDLWARSSYTQGRPFASSDYQGVRVISLPSLPVRGIDAFATSALGAMLSLGKKYDIIHFHALGPALFSAISQVASSAKIVVTCQGLDWQRAKWGSFSTRMIRMGEKAAVRYADEIIVVSEQLGSYFANTYDRKTTYIPNAPASYQPSDPEFTYAKTLGLTPGKYMVFLGRLVPEKCPDLLVNAFLKLKPKGWKLVLAGGVSDTKLYVSDLLNSIASSSDVIFAGELRGARLAEVMRGAGLFVLPSDLEGLPLAMLEAMNEGIPVVGSNIPPHQQLLGNERGKMFTAGDLNSCVAALDWAIGHPEQMQAMAHKAQQYVRQHYSWEHITAENLNLYQRLLDSPQSAPTLPSTSQPLAEVYQRK